MTFKVFTDGGSRGNPGPSACAYVVYSDSGNMQEMCGKPALPIAKRGRYLGTMTNNEAEYHGVIEALCHPDVTSGSRINFFSDSQLMVNQLNGLWKVKEPRLRELITQIRELARGRELTFTYVPREQNKVADALVNETLDKHSGLRPEGRVE